MKTVKKIAKVLLILGILFPNVALSQINQVDPCGGVGGTTLPPAVQNAPYNVRLSSALAGAWSVPTVPSGSGLSIVDVGGFGELRSNSIVLTPGSYSVRIFKGAVSMNFDFDVIAPCPVTPPCGTEFAFVLDQSGSMGIPLSVGGTRWENLITSIQTYFPAIQTKLSLGSNDHWSIILFEGNNANIIGTGDFSALPNLSTTSPGLFAGETPGGLTPIGGGIQRAMQDFFVFSKVPWKRQVVVLLTDGRQNKNPVVLTPSRTIDSIAATFGRNILNGGANAGSLPIDFESGSSIYRHFKIHSIGIGVGTSDVEFSQLQSFSSSGLFYSTDGTGPNLSTHLNSILVNAFQGCSPRILEMSLETINQSIQTKSFVVNDSTHYLTLQFLAEQRFRNPQINIYYNDTIQDFEPVIRNDQQILYRIDFLSSRNGRIRPSKGIWRVSYSDLQSNDPIPMLFTAIVEDKNIHHSQDFNNVGKVYAGDDIPVRVKVEKDQEGLNQQVTVKAYLLKPGDDLGDLAARNSFDPGSPNPDLTQGQSKMDFISMTKPFSDLLTTKKIPEITLTSAGNGEYNGRFSGNEVRGPYQIVSYIQGTYPSLGNFQGRESRFIHVDFSRPEDIRLRDELVFLNKGDNVINHYLLRIRPINKFGRYLGPAQESRIKFSLSDGNVGQIVDNLDGTYSAVLDVPVGSNPQVKIHVIDFEKAVRTRRLSRYDSTGWILCLAAGVSLPLQNTYKSGVFGEIGLGYRFTPQWGVELLGGGYTFRRNHHILGATLWGKYSFNNVNAWGMDLHLGAGAGIFSPKGGNSETGYGLKAALSKDLQPWFRLGLDIAYFNLPNSNSNFTTLGIGVQFKL